MSSISSLLVSLVSKLQMQNCHRFFTSDWKFQFIYEVATASPVAETVFHRSQSEWVEDRDRGEGAGRGNCRERKRTQKIFVLLRADKKRGETMKK